MPKSKLKDLIVKIKSPLYHIALDCLDRHAQDPKHKNKAAVIFASGDVACGEREKSRSFSYAALKRFVDRTARYFSEWSLPPQSRIVLRLNNTPEFAAAFLGAMKAGLLPVVTSPLLSERELRVICRHAKAAALVGIADATLGKLVTKKPTGMRHMIKVGCDAKKIRVPDFESTVKKYPARFFAQAGFASDPAFVLYTSGTESLPKAVWHAHRAIAAHDKRTRLWLDFRKGDVVFNTGSLSWSYALNAGFLDVLRSGGTALCYDGPLDPVNFVHLINRYGVTTFMSVPALYARVVGFLKTHHIEFNRLRVCLSAGDQLDAVLQEDFYKLTGLAIYQGFGMTENSVYLFEEYGKKSQRGSVGKAGEKDLIKILRSDGSECAADEEGEFAVHQTHPGLMLGYQDADGAPQIPLCDGWFMTGDRGYRTARGCFYFSGRRDEIINSSGYRISPREIENVLLSTGWFKEVAVFPEPNRAGNTVVAAALVAHDKKAAQNLMERKTREFCQKNLARFKIPKKFIFLKELPKTNNGKIRRKKLLGK